MLLAIAREAARCNAPLPARWFVPGDRVWFRNPDERSADAAGFEGSWVVYLGAGRFSDFWERGRPFTLERKCVEIHHWRDPRGVYDEGGCMDRTRESARWVRPGTSDIDVPPA